MQELSLPTLFRQVPTCLPNPRCNPAERTVAGLTSSFSSGFPSCALSRGGRRGHLGSRRECCSGTLRLSMFHTSRKEICNPLNCNKFVSAVSAHTRAGVPTYIGDLFGVFRAVCRSVSAILNRRRLTGLPTPCAPATSRVTPLRGIFARASAGAIRLAACAFRRLRRHCRRSRMMWGLRSRRHAMVPDPALAAAIPAGDVPDTRLTCSLEEPGPVWLAPVGDADDRRLWEAVMERHHPLGWARPPGGQMRYWIRSERHGVLGGIGFGSATWQLQARDEWIGWSADARAANFGRVLCNHRFLLLPGVRGLRAGVAGPGHGHPEGGGRLGEPLFGTSGGGLHPCRRGIQRILLPPRRLDGGRAD